MDLSVAIIFKNEIRCIERCLRSIQSLKKRVSCEIVMADTGSTDGSRAVAEQYADIVLDFLWINDFAAARNAVLERCSGTWVLTMDCDEWLDADVDELAAFVQDRKMRSFSGAGVILRDYLTEDLNRHRDLLLLRVLRMGARPRYVGAIHERPHFDAGNGESVQLLKTILHHDGYVMLNSGFGGKEKQTRNLILLRAELERSPDDLYRLLQFLESAKGEEDYLTMLRKAANLVVAQKGNWRHFGAPILRYAIFDAYNLKLPELDKWMDATQKLFSQSYYTRIDVEFVCFIRAVVCSDSAAAIKCGEAFLNACAAFRNDSNAYVETDISFLQKNDSFWEQYVRLRLAEAYREKDEIGRAMELLAQTDWTLLDERDTRLFLELLGALRTAGCDIQPLLVACRDGLNARSDAHAEECRTIFHELTEEEKPSEELLRLAAKMKAILEKLSPDDPTVMELKKSAAYQRVAQLLEGDRT